MLFDAASAGCGQQFVGAQPIGRVEGDPQAFHRFKIAGLKHLVHETDFFHANAMLARYTSTACETLVENLAAGLQDSLNFRFVTFVKKQDGMQVAVACVEDIDDLDVILLTDFSDST